MNKTKPTTLPKPHHCPVMCASCDYQNQVRGKWKGDVFHPESDKCPKCEAKEKQP